MHIFVDSLAHPRIEIEGDDFQHLARALRVRPGDKFQLLEIEGENTAVGMVTDMAKRSLAFNVGKVEKKPVEMGGKVRLVQSMIKPQRMDLLVQKAVELGVSQIQPVISEYTIMKSNQFNLSRYQKIAREAAMQSERWVLPEILGPLKLKDCLQAHKSEQQAFAFALKGTDYTFQNYVKKHNIDSDVQVFIGPEGGFSDEDRRHFQDAKIPLIKFGESILRAETAALAVLSVLRFQFD